MPERAAAERRGAARSASLVALGRGLGGAIVFALPMLMTMEMWWLGFYAERSRLLLLLFLNIPLLVLLAHAARPAKSFLWRRNLLEAATAWAIGIAGSALILTVFNVLQGGMPPDEIAGKVALQSVPASIGALLGRSMLGGDGDRDELAEGPDRPAYANEMFVMAIGALFLSFNVAPTEEMILIAYKMTSWHAAALVCLTLVLMHGFVYAVEFRGGAEPSPETPWWSNFLRFTVAGYALAALVSLYVLWTFGRLDGISPGQAVMTAAVLAFPAGIGAAAARLIL